MSVCSRRKVVSVMYFGVPGTQVNIAQSRLGDAAQLATPAILEI